MAATSKFSAKLLTLMLQLGVGGNLPPDGFLPSCCETAWSCEKRFDDFPEYEWAKKLKKITYLQ